MNNWNFEAPMSAHTQVNANSWELTSERSQLRACIWMHLKAHSWTARVNASRRKPGTLWAHEARCESSTQWKAGAGRGKRVLARHRAESKLLKDSTVWVFQFEITGSSNFQHVARTVSTLVHSVHGGSGSAHLNINTHARTSYFANKNNFGNQWSGPENPLKTFPRSCSHADSWIRKIPIQKFENAI